MESFVFKKHSGASEISLFHPVQHSDVPRLIIILFTRCAAAVYSGGIKSICSLYACVMRWPTYTPPPPSPSQNKKMDSTFILVFHSGYCSAALLQGGVDNEWENPVNSTARQLSQLSSWIWLAFCSSWWQIWCSPKFPWWQTNVLF